MEGDLVLSPGLLHVACPVAALVERLTQLGILGEPLADMGFPAFGAGPEFLQWVSFLGCSPHVEFAPRHPGDRRFTFLSFHGPFPEPRFAWGRNTPAPRCASCRKILPHWNHATLEHQAPLPAALRCPYCQALASAAQWDWRKGAGLGYCFLNIHQIFPKEAVPADALLRELAGLTGAEWRYWYVLEPQWSRVAES